MDSPQELVNQNFKCEVCEKSFATTNSKLRHIKLVHGEEEKTIICNVCSKVFREEKELQKHLKAVHEGQRNYKCDSCGKSFTQAGSLKIDSFPHS